jgi:hypothetical protein
MASETASSADEEKETLLVSTAGGERGGTDKRGKHRILAELKRLQQDTKFLQVRSC